MKENYYLDDGTYSASQIVIVMVKRHLEGLGKDMYGSLLADLKEPVESSEFRLKLKVGIHQGSTSRLAPACLPRRGHPQQPAGHSRETCRGLRACADAQGRACLRERRAHWWHWRWLGD